VELENLGEWRNGIRATLKMLSALGG